MAKDEKLPTAKTTVQIVDVSSGAEVHHKKITIHLNAHQVERYIREVMGPHIFVAPAKKASKPKAVARDESSLEEWIDQDPNRAQRLGY